jgi:uncharacterized membrane protein YhaH (DUF805 family)
VVVDAALDNLDDTPVATIGLPVLLFLATIVPALAVTIRRLHDIGLSGWFYLVVFIPSVGSLIILVMTLMPSQKHENRWGPAPEGDRSLTIRLAARRRLRLRPSPAR